MGVLRSWVYHLYHLYSGSLFFWLQKAESSTEVWEQCGNTLFALGFVCQLYEYVDLTGLRPPEKGAIPIHMANPPKEKA